MTSWISKTVCWVKEANFQKVHTVWYFRKGKTLGMENRSIVARSQGRRKGLPIRGARSSPGVMELVSVLTVVVITQIQGWVKTQRTVHPKKDVLAYVNFFRFSCSRGKVSPFTHVAFTLSRLQASSHEILLSPGMYNYWLSLEPRRN